MRRHWSDQAGVTLIELVMAIVVIGIAFAGILTVYLTSVRSSADPMIQRQAISIADAYLDEILAKAYADPDGVDGEGDRSQFDDVDDYTRLPDTRVRNQFGQLIAGLENYRVVVAISSASLGSPAVTAWQVEIDVQYSDGTGAVVRGYRAGY